MCWPVCLLGFMSCLLHVVIGCCTCWLERRVSIALYTCRFVALYTCRSVHLSLFALVVVRVSVFACAVLLVLLAFVAHMSADLWVHLRFTCAGMNEQLQICVLVAFCSIVRCYIMNVSMQECKFGQAQIMGDRRGHPSAVCIESAITKFVASICLCPVESNTCILTLFRSDALLDSILNRNQLIRIVLLAF